MKKAYQKPALKAEKMFERTVLACLKCAGEGNVTGKCRSSYKLS